MSTIATMLLMKWGWGILSAVDIQELAQAVKVSGNTEDEIDDIASCGGYGVNTGHIHRDLMRKFCSKMYAPEPVKVIVPYLDTTGKKLPGLSTDIDIFLPSQWIVSLANNEALEFEYDAIFGISKLQDFWKTQKTTPNGRTTPVQKHRYSSKAIP
eukprot:9083303-Lingulodinium_polyedra.AAC.1